MKLNLYIFTMISFLFTNLSFASVLKCRVSTDHSKGELSQKEKSLSFSFDTLKDSSKSLQISGYRFLIWKDGDFLMIKIKGGEFSKALSIQFSVNQSMSRFHYGEDFDFTCEALKLKKVSYTDFSLLKEDISLKVMQDLSFPYLQSEEVELMRTLFFQDEKIYFTSTKLIPKLPWCSLRIQLSRNEDTLVKKGEVFVPVSFETHNNNSYFSTYSYSFVDFATGKKKGVKRLYSPFMFNCNLLRAMAFSEDTLLSIVGKNLKIESR